MHTLEIILRYLPFYPIIPIPKKTYLRDHYSLITP